jgi:hypothetical protein
MKSLFSAAFLVVASLSSALLIEITSSFRFADAGSINEAVGEAFGKGDAKRARTKVEADPQRTGTKVESKHTQRTGTKVESKHTQRTRTKVESDPDPQRPQRTRTKVESDPDPQRPQRTRTSAESESKK